MPMKRTPARRWFDAVLVAGGSLAALCAACWIAVARAGTGRCFDKVDEVPVRAVAMVLGCPKHLTNGADSLEYDRRVKAAAALFKAGRCGLVLVSSDIDAKAMMRDVQAAGVPVDRLSYDPFGVRTRDSFLRAQRVYGIHGGIVVSQRYHNERSLYIADEIGGDWVGFDARSAVGWPKWRSRGREVLARVKAVLDRYVLRPEAGSLKP